MQKHSPYGLDTEIFNQALTVELETLGLKTEVDKEIKIKYRKKIIGAFFIDIAVENCVVIKIISDNCINEKHEIEIKNQLRLTEFEVGLILNFDIENQHKRLVFTNDFKKTEKN